MSRKKQARRTPTSQVKLDFQTLENRNLLAGIFFDSLTGVVTIAGSGVADAAQVNLVNDQVEVRLNGFGIQNFSPSVVTRVVFSGGDGDDWFRNNTAIPTQANGHRGNDTLIGGSGNDVLRGGDDQDRIHGNAGRDLMLGDSGRDTFVAGSGDDTIDGGLGNDRAFGDSGNDLINLREGNDFADGGLDDDVINGEAGDDKISGRAGNDSLSGGLGHDLLFGDDGVDRLFGDDGHDTLDGGNGDDFVRGGNGNDDLEGQAGNDDLNGDSGDDNVVGGSGSDQMAGGSGNDDFSRDSQDSVSDSAEDYGADGDFEIRGPISGLDPLAKTFSILGFQVHYGNARIEGLLTNGAFFKAEGSNVAGVVQATEVEQKLPSDSIDNFEARGTVSNLDTVNQTFSFFGLTVEYDNAQVNGTLADGASIKVEGFLDAGIVAAREIYFGFQDDIHVSRNFELRAAISNLDPVAKTFTLLGLQVDYSRAFVQGQIAEGTFVKVDGNLSNGILTAREVELELEGDRDRNVEALGTISNLDTAAKTFTLLGISVDYSQARLDTSLQEGALIRLEGWFASGLIDAERIR